MAQLNMILTCKVRKKWRLGPWFIPYRYPCAVDLYADGRKLSTIHLDRLMVFSKLDKSHE